MELADKAIKTRDAIAARIAMHEIEVGKAVAASARCQQEYSQEVIH
jgi:hypothetical protein